MEIRKHTLLLLHKLITSDFCFKDTPIFCGDFNNVEDTIIYCDKLIYH